VRAAIVLMWVFLWTATAQANIRSEPWGVTPDGRAVTLYTLANDKGITVQISNFGGIVVSLLAPDQEGRIDRIVQGFDDLTPYLNDGAHYGATIGRYANRIGGAAFDLGGKTYRLVTTNNATVQSHGGPNGYFRRVWDAEIIDGKEPSLRLRLVDPDGEMGFPGTVQIQVTYSLRADGALRIDYRATTDKPTVINLTNHSYFSLQGQAGGTVDDQTLQLFSDAFLPGDKTGMPLGEIRPVAGSDFDFRQPALLGPRLASSDVQITQSKGFDHTFVVQGTPGRLRIAARLRDPKSGRSLEVWTTQPGIQVYTSNSVRPAVRDSRHYVPHGAVAFEAQHYPNSPNQPNFPSTVITPQRPLHEVTEFRFPDPQIPAGRGVN
jgi:aldose 1-epimerase